MSKAMSSSFNLLEKPSLRLCPRNCRSYQLPFMSMCLCRCCRYMCRCASESAVNRPRGKEFYGQSLPMMLSKVISLGTGNPLGRRSCFSSIEVLSVLGHLRLMNGWLVRVILSFAPFRYRRPSKSELDIMWRAANEKAKVRPNEDKQINLPPRCPPQGLIFQQHSNCVLSERDQIRGGTWKTQMLWSTVRRPGLRAVCVYNP